MAGEGSPLLGGPKDNLRELNHPLHHPDHGTADSIVQGLPWERQRELCSASLAKHSKTPPNKQL